MADFETPTDLLNNRGLVSDPDAFGQWFGIIDMVKALENGRGN